MQTFEALDRARRLAGLSIPRVCKAARVSRTTWWRWLHGETTPNARTLHKIESALDQLGLYAPAPARDKLSLIRAGHAATRALLDVRLDAELQNASQYWRQKHQETFGSLRGRLVRDLALYVTVIDLGLTATRVGQAIGLSKQRMSQIIANVEALRESDKRFERILNETQAELHNNGGPHG